MQLQSSYESRIIAVRQYLIENRNIVSNPNNPPKSATKPHQTSKREYFVQKPLHGFFYKQIDKDNNIDKQQSLAWTKDRSITSDLEGYMGTITE